jgi:hypothetical protein
MNTMTYKQIFDLTDGSDVDFDPPYYDQQDTPDDQQDTPRFHMRYLPREVILAMDDSEQLTHLRDEYLLIAADITGDLEAGDRMPTHDPEWGERARRTRRGFIHAARNCERRLIELGAGDGWTMGHQTMPKAIVRGLVGYNGRLMEQIDELQELVEALVSSFLVLRLYSVPNNTINIVDSTNEELAAQARTIDGLKAHQSATSKTISALTTENGRLRAAVDSMTAAWKQKPSAGRQAAAMAQEIATLTRTCTRHEGKIRDLSRQLAAAKETIALAGDAADQAKSLRGAMRAEKRNAVTIEFVNVAKIWLDDEKFEDIMHEAKHRAGAAK